MRDARHYMRPRCSQIFRRFVLVVGNFLLERFDVFLIWRRRRRRKEFHRANRSFQDFAHQIGRRLFAREQEELQHRLADDWVALRRQVDAFLDQFATGADDLLHYVGLRGDGKLALACRMSDGLT